MTLFGREGLWCAGLGRDVDDVDGCGGSAAGVDGLRVVVVVSVRDPFFLGVDSDLGEEACGVVVVVGREEDQFRNAHRRS